MPGATSRQPPTLLEQGRQVRRLHHDSMPTERASLEWLGRSVRCHRLRSHDALFPPAPNIEAFLTHLAVHGQVAAATQHQALPALVCLDTRVLTQTLAGRSHAVRAHQTSHVPVVLTRAAVAALIALLDGTAPLVATRLYGRGWRLMAAVRLRVQDIDGQLTPLTVRSGQGDKDRFTTVPATLTPLFPNHLAGVRTRHQQDLAPGHGEVSLPHARARPSPHAPQEWGWPSVFPARDLSVDPRAGVTRRQHGDPSVIHHAIKGAVRRAGLTQPISAQTVRHACATHRRQRGTDIRTMQHRLGHHDRATTMLDTHLLPQGGQGVRPSPSKQASLAAWLVT